MIKLLQSLPAFLLLLGTGMAAEPVSRMPGSAVAFSVSDERLAIAGAHIGQSLTEVKTTARQDLSLHISADNRLFYACKMVDPTLAAKPLSPEKIQIGPNVSTFTMPPVAVNSSSAFLLHSKPGASRVIYLDFNGHITPAYIGGWSSSAIITPAFQLAGTASPLAQSNLDAIRDIWLHVSEDYSTWDVDITTEQPLPTARGQRCVIGGNSLANPAGGLGIAGVSWVGEFGGLYTGLSTSPFIDGNDEPNFVFVDFGLVVINPTVTNVEVLVVAISHELGHTLGLKHWGETALGSGKAYTGGHSIAGLAGVASVCPIMGNSSLPGWPSNCNLNQWSKGEYPFSVVATSSGTQDDLAVISSFITRSPDDHGDTLLTATQVPGAVLTAGGMITDKSDVDLMKIHPGPGPLSITAQTQSTYRTRVSNLKVGLSLLDDNGITVARNVSLAGMGSTLSYNVPTQGTYYIKVVGVGYNPSGTTWTNTGITGTILGNSLTGFTNYGSLGRYSLSGTWTPGPPPLAVPVWTNPSANIFGAPFAASFTGTGSSSLDGMITSYRWDFGDGYSLPVNNTSILASPTHTYQAPGNYIVSLTVTDISGGVSANTKITVPITGVFLANHLKVTAMTASWRNATNVENAATVAIQCVNIYGQPARSAAVYINVTGSLKGKAAARADANGMVYITMPKQLKKASVSYTFTVSNITLPGYSYTGAENVISSVTISQNP